MWSTRQCGTHVFLRLAVAMLIVIVSGRSVGAAQVPHVALGKCWEASEAYENLLGIVYKQALDSSDKNMRQKIIVSQRQWRALVAAEDASRNAYNRINYQNASASSLDACMKIGVLENRVTELSAYLKPDKPKLALASR